MLMQINLRSGSSAPKAMLQFLTVLTLQQQTLEYTVNVLLGSIEEVAVSEQGYETRSPHGLAVSRRVFDSLTSPY
jgi:hypothetical protein